MNLIYMYNMILDGISGAYQSVYLFFNIPNRISEYQISKPKLSSSLNSIKISRADWRFGPPSDSLFSIFVGDLTSKIGEELLQKSFEGCGEIHSVSVIRDRKTGLSKNFAFINFVTVEGRNNAVELGKTLVIDGRRVTINISANKSRIV